MGKPAMFAPWLPKLLLIAWHTLLYYGSEVGNCLAGRLGMCLPSLLKGFVNLICVALFSRRLLPRMYQTHSGYE